MPNYALDFKLGDLTCQMISIHSEKETHGEKNIYYEHYHSSLELHYLESGSCEFICHKQTFPVNAGQLLIIPPHAYHRMITASEKIRKLSILIDISTPRKHGSADIALHNAFSGDEPITLSIFGTPMSTTLSRIRELIFDDGVRYLKSEKMRALFELFMVDLFEYTVNDENMSSERAEKRLVSQEVVIDSFIAMSFSSGASVSKLAKKLHVSERQLYRMIRKKYGMNYREKTKENRIEIATGFLTGTEKSMAEIAELLGYNSGSAFSAFIKNATGKTPTQIRKGK